MAFRFKQKEDIAEGFNRIASGQIKRALREWKKPDRSIAVHETRKCIKRLRALLRLVKPALPPQVFADENAGLRDIGRLLSVSRDLQVMSETVAELSGEAADDIAEKLTVLAGQPYPCRHRQFAGCSATQQHYDRHGAARSFAAACRPQVEKVRLRYCRFGIRADLSPGPPPHAGTVRHAYR
ncbi:MAG: CHAD domain-containing protein [Alphaproteobacteria bacterium]|nr:CHAD domain-containing protein [Alphaproteobacteria bacterium]